LSFGPSPVFDPTVARLPSPQHRPTGQLASWPLTGPPGLPFFSPAGMQAHPHLPPSIKTAERCRPSCTAAPHQATTRLPCHGEKSTCDTPPLTPPLLVASASPSFGNRRAPPSMASPSLHSRPVASLPFGTNKRHPSHAAPHLTPPCTTLLSSSLTPELAPHHVPSIATHLPPSPGRFTTAPSPVRKPATLPCPLSVPRPSRRPQTSHSAYVSRSWPHHCGLRPDVVHSPWTESTAFSSQK
jgi:hypothetical protein